jgi:hypothetical protein
MSDDTPDQDASPDADDDLKAKFRQALQRKGTHPQGGQGPSHREDSAHGDTDTHAHGAKREFRRKSG